MNVYDAQRKPLRLGEIVGRGGEAVVYRIEGQPERLAKIYVPEPRPTYTGKITWMANHPPENPTQRLEHASLAWPESPLFDARRKMVGYRMPFIQSAVPLLEVFNPRRRAEVLPRFNRRYLLRTAHNLAAALGALHRSGYVAGDLNESNVLVTSAALVTLIDTDSFQVREERGGRQVVHPCPVGKAEYTPPELQGKTLSDIIRLPDHDSFGLAVLLFQLLMEGSHPFRAQWLAAGDPPPLEVRIANGAYPYVQSPAYPVRPPKNSLGIETLHPWLSELFRRCFIDGHLDPRWRPGPDLWARALSEAESSMITCSQGHFYFSHLSECPYCQVLAKRANGRHANTVRGGWSPPPYNQPRTAAAPRKQKANPTPAAASGNTPPPQPAQGRPNPSAGRPTFRTANPFFGRFSFAGFGAPSGSGAASVMSPSQSGARVFSGPAVLRSVLQGRPLIPQGMLGGWVRRRAYQSLLVGGGQGAVAGAIPGAMLGLLNWSSSEMLAWSIIMAAGGAVGGFLRGWTPGHKMASLINRYVGWRLFWEALGLLAGLIGGGMLGLLFVWAVFPVILGLVLGAQAGRYLGRKIYQVGSFLGWERLWGGISALGFGALGYGLARLVGLAGLDILGLNLGEGLLPFAANGDVLWALLWMLAGAGGGALAGAFGGIGADLIGRLSGLVD